jgi:hypothetical protein
MNVEIGAEAALFPEKEYIHGIAVAVELVYTGSMCTAVLIGNGNPPATPTDIWAQMRRRYWSAKIDRSLLPYAA